MQPDCGTYPCRDDCCSEGCDVWPAERDALLASGLARSSDFDEGYEDEEGDCTFLESTRGCRLHTSGLKPAVCAAVPRDTREADEMKADGMLPCRSEWRAFP